jgi:collagenase-like PrtC family protease
MIELFQELDIQRIIFHRKNTVEDMKRCIEANNGKGLEFEAFALNEYCHFTGAFCNSLHCDELTHLCKVPYVLGDLKAGKSHLSMCKDLTVTENKEEACEEGYVTGQTGCGLCALKELKEIGVTHLKVVGRGNHTAYMAEDIRQMKRALLLADETESVEEYKRLVKEKLFVGKCMETCYYREK